MIRLYVESPLFQDQEILLSEAQSHYLQNVMRLKGGDDLLIFNGEQGEWEAKISKQAKRASVLIPSQQMRLQPPQDDVWLLFSPLKPKSQLFLDEKATELGVGTFLPVKCARTTCAVNPSKMKAHLIEAAEQSGRLTLPTIRPMTSFLSLLESWPQDRVLLFGDATLTAPVLTEYPWDPKKSYAFFIGPEGGFSPSELERLRAHPQSYGVTLSQQTLRAETAGIVGLSYLQLKKMKNVS